MPPKPGQQNTPIKLTRKQLDEMIEKATVDAYNESEQRSGFQTLIDEHLAVPFETQVLGVAVTVGKIDINDADEIIAVCHRGKERLRVPVLDLPLPTPPPKGWQWIEAYRHWLRG
jgi:hypothetical protein